MGGGGNVKFIKDGKEKVIKLYSKKKKKLIHPVHSLKLHLSVMMIVCDYSRAMLSAPGELTSYSGKGKKDAIEMGTRGQQTLRSYTSFARRYSVISKQFHNRLDIPLLCTTDSWCSLNTFLTRNPVISDTDSSRL